MPTRKPLMYSEIHPILEIRSMFSKLTDGYGVSLNTKNKNRKYVEGVAILDSNTKIIFMVGQIT